MSNFGFLQPEFPAIYNAAQRASAAVYPDPRAACFYARRALELAVSWAFKHDPALRLPYQDTLSALIHEPTFRASAGETVYVKAQLITRLGNQAVHSQAQISTADALTAVREFFHVSYWLAHTYSRAVRPASALVFNPQLLPRTAPIPRQTLEQLQSLEAGLRERDEKLSAILADRNALDEELKRLRAEVAEARRAAESRPDTHDYSEAETRDTFIDLLLREAGWPLNEQRDREFPVSGMPNAEGHGFVDYVLWGDDGKPLALIEAKRTKRDPRVGQQQAKLYADCLDQQFGQRPVIFYTNGYEHWLWDDAQYPPRSVQGFFKKAELELMIQRRSTRLSLAGATIDSAIVERAYQTRAIRRICEAFEKNRDRRGLLVMATGAGKTRTVIALCDVLMRCNWAKRILFLADRVALVNQAVNAFKLHLPAASPVNLVTEKNTEGRVFVSTYPTMMGLIDETNAETGGGLRRFGPGHFDLIVIDEAHRSIYQRYGAIFDYFDSLLVGLTATPVDEIDRNTYRLFHLETGVPTDVYGIDEAVRDGYLVPPKAVSVPLRFQREGIDYNGLSDEEKAAWDDLEWTEEGEVPNRVEAEAVNKWLFNIDTVDKVLQHLMTRGQKVASGDKIGKTIIFAKNQAHANFIEDRFNRNYPHYKGSFARTITFQTGYAQSLINAFSNSVKPPQIAISVDMLDTGIDVPEVLNLVFFKLVRSKTKFWQMLGRGTRLCPDVFGPGTHKKFFYIFDYCQNLEYFSQNPEATEGAGSESLSKRLFVGRLELIEELDRRYASNASEQERALRQYTAGELRTEVAQMNLNNFIVRPKRRYVERYAEPAAWKTLNLEHYAELAEHVAGLPTEAEDPDIEACQFDYLMLRLQLALLRAEPAFTRLRETVQGIAQLFSEKESIPMVREQMELILEVLTDAFWEDVTAPILDGVRRRLRALVKLIEKTKRKPVFTDFADEMGEEIEIVLPGIVAAGDFERFREKARAFLRKHEDHPAIRKVRENERLNSEDLLALERLLLEAGIGTAEDIRQAREASHGFGLFIRSLAGMDRQAATKAFEHFLQGRRLTANQHEFVELVLSHLTERGYVDPVILYESPFTDLSARGVEGLFASGEVVQIVEILADIRHRALAG